MMEKLAFLVRACACAGCALAMTSSAEEVVVSAGETLDLTTLSSGSPDNDVVRVADGGTVTVPRLANMPADGQPGFAWFYGQGMPNEASWPTNGTSLAEALANFGASDVMGVASCATLAEQYSTLDGNRFHLYAAKWHLAEAGTYSFFEHFASRVMLAIDGTVVLADTIWNGPTCARNVTLAAGDHEVVIVLASSGKDNGNGNAVFGHANSGKVPGLVFNPDNVEMTFDNFKKLNDATPKVVYPNAKHFTNDVDGVDAPFSTWTPPNLRRGLTIWHRLVADGGVATIDLSGEGAVPRLVLSGGVFSEDGGTFQVKGSDDIFIGGYTYSGVHNTFYDADISFVDAAGEPNANGIVRFVSSVTLRHDLPACYTYRNDVQMGFWDVVGLWSDGTFTVDGFSATALDYEPYGHPARIVVKNGRELDIKPCVVSPSHSNQWYGVVGTNSAEIVLEAGSALKFVNLYNCWMTDAVHGTGTVTLDWGTPNTSRAPTTYFMGGLDVTGTVAVVKGAAVAEQAEMGPETHVTIDAGSYKNTNKETVNYQASFRLRPAGAGTADTAVRIASLEGVGTSIAVQWICKRQTLTVGTLAGKLTFRGDDETGKVVVENWNSKLVNLTAMTNLVVNGATPGATVNVCADKPTRIVLPEHATEMGVRLDCTVPGVRYTIANIPAEGIARLLLENGAIAEFEGSGAIACACGDGRVEAAGTLTIGVAEGNVRVVTTTGGIVSAPVTTQHHLGTDVDPALWLDAASPAERFNQLFMNNRLVTYTNDSVVIDKWFDARFDHDALYGWNRRCEDNSKNQQVYPYLLADACNGLPTVQFGRFKNMVDGVWSSSFADDSTSNRENRRMPFNQPITAKYAVMVFGSEQGGGTSVLGGWNLTEYTNGPKYTTPGVLGRFTTAEFAEDQSTWNSPLSAAACNPAYPIFTVNRPTWLDGVRVDPTTTGFNGGYQILSFAIDDGNGNGVPVQSLGGYDVANSSSGQIYGEVLIFTNALTDVQRQRVETYLSKKWGIALAASGGDAPLTVQGATGTVTVEGGAAARGYFGGTVTIAAGGHLEIPALALPWGEQDVPRENLRGWYDPDDETRYLKRTIPDDTRPLAVDALFSKFSGTTSATYDGVAFLSGYLGQTDYVTADASNRADRRPWKATGARGTGPERTWLDYTVYPQYDNSGNCLRPKTTFSEWSALGSANRVAQTWRTAFIVMDTSAGGGNALCDQSGMTPLKARKGYLASDPIWAKGSPVAVTGGVTRLDGVVVNGSTCGYSGRPELLTVQPTANQSFYALGYYNGTGPNGESKERSHEILGEMIFYTTALDAETCGKIEAYLMGKWLGKLPEGYVDWRRATVAGAGSLTAPSPAYLPQFDAAYAGAVALTTNELTFAADATGAVTNAIALPVGATCALPATGVVHVRAAGRLRAGALVSAGAGVTCGEQAAGVPEGWTLDLEPACEDARLLLKDGALMLDIPSGTMLIFR